MTLRSAASGVSAAEAGPGGHAVGRATEAGRRLLEWGEAHRRDFPWRRTRDPWAVLVSEVMLQQTQAARVVDPFLRFMELFPDPPTCSAAPLAQVVRAWAGLGYNRRAQNLHRAAGAVVAHHGGRLPAGLDDLRRLPGVGEYTARAVQAFAFGADVGVVDTNGARLLARAVAGEPLGRRQAQELADALVPEGHAWEVNQAVFDLGATVCLRRRPRCSACPLASTCRWAATRWASPDPAEGSAGAGRPQSPFAGSDRQGRGRLIDALRAGPLEAVDVAVAAGWPGDPPRALEVLEGLIAEGLVYRSPCGRLELA